MLRRHICDTLSATLVWLLTYQMCCAESAALSPPEAPILQNPRMIEGIKHRILAYLYRAHSKRVSAADVIRKFFYYFQDYADLIIWKVSHPENATAFAEALLHLIAAAAWPFAAELHLRPPQIMTVTAQAQLLDRRTLLLSTGLRNPTRTKSSSVGFPTLPTACAILSPHPLLEH